MEHEEYQVLYKESDSVVQDLWLFHVKGDEFAPIPNGLQANGTLVIPDWRNKDKDELSKEFAKQYGIWGGDSFNNPYGNAPGVLPQEYRLRPASPLVGCYYKRIYRPIWHGWNNRLDLAPPEARFDDFALVRQIERLTSRVMEAAEYIEPTKATIPTFSVALREILILQCTEIETVLQRLLIEHGQSPKGRNWNTSDYVRTIGALRLKDYTMHFPTFPKIGFAFSPFADWTKASPTKSLVFYYAYNKAKHNREDGLEYATFRNVLLSYAALIIVAFASYGPEIAKAQSLNNFVHLKTPEWKIDDHYIPVFRARGTSLSRNHQWVERTDFQFT